jgi:short subunit fatty acids transporter
VPSLGRAVHRESYSLDGIDYELIVYAAPGGLYGTFACSDCGFTGVSPLMSGTQDDALAHARKSMKAHHQTTHEQAKP